MIFGPNSNGKLYDVMGNLIPYVTQWDDETEEAVLLIQARSANFVVVSVEDNGSKEILKVKVKIPGAKMKLV